METSRASTTLRELLEQGEAVVDHPWPRTVVTRETWLNATHLLQAQRCTLLGLWGEGARVHMALLDEALGDPGIVSLECEGNAFPSVGHLHPPAIRLERALRDLSGLEAQGLPDARPWLDHGRWALRHPLGAAERVAP